MGTVLSSLLKRRRRRRSSNDNHQGKQKVILITGASSGIGKHAALTLVRHYGHIVYGVARRVECMQELVAAGGHVIGLDLTDPKGHNMEACIQRILTEQGRIDVLVNNAGMAVVGSVEHVAMDEARRMFDVNFFGMAKITQQVIPHMRKAQSGRIINISSILGRTYMPFYSYYAATKHAMEGWSDCLRGEMASFNVKVSIIQAGAIQTDFRTTALGDAYRNVRGIHDEKSAYRSFFFNLTQRTKSAVDRASSPEVITKLIVDAVENPRPRRRYVGGTGSSLSLFMRNWLGDAVVDLVNYLLMRD